MTELACPSSVFVERLTHQWTTNTFLHDAQTANVCLANKYTTFKHERLFNSEMKYTND